MNPINRRQVIKTLMFGTAFSNVFGAGWAATMRYELESAEAFLGQPGLLSVKLADFPELSQPRGSIRLATSLIGADNHPVGLFPPVIINRGDKSQIYVLGADCTHEGCIVGRLDPASGRMTCPCHGSQYAADGQVLQGPAEQSLSTMTFRQTTDTLAIDLPEVFYQITAQRLAPQPRLCINFIAFAGITYQIFFRENLAAAPRLASFATTPDGAADQTDAPGIDDYLSLYVDRAGSAGFFQVAMKSFRLD